MSDDNSYGFGGKLIGAIVLALLGGYAWACFDTGRSPLAILSIFGGKEDPEPAAKTAPAPKPAPKPDPVVVKKTETPKPVAEPVVKKTDPAPAPVGPKPYSAVDMSILFNETDDLLRRGKFFDARN